MKERKFVSCLRFGARSVGWHPVAKHDDQVPSTRRQYDCGLVEPGGHYHAIEAKRIGGRGQMSWNYDKERGGLKTHQREWLEQAVSVGATAWIVMWLCCAFSPAQAKARGTTRLYEARAVSAPEVFAERAAGKRLFEVDWWLERGILLPRLKPMTPPRFDPRPLADARRQPARAVLVPAEVDPEDGEQLTFDLAARVELPVASVSITVPPENRDAALTILTGKVRCWWCREWKTPDDFERISQDFSECRACCEDARPTARKEAPT